MKLPSWFKRVPQYIVLVILTSLILLSAIISLPQTEKVLNQEWNLNFNTDELFEKEYTLNVIYDPIDIVYKWKYVNQTKNIIFERLKKYGVEFVEINYHDTQESSGELKIFVRSTKDPATVETLLSQRADIFIVTRKSDVDFYDESNPYAVYDYQNYEDTNLNLKFFRTIYVTKLQSSAGDMSYFGILKTPFWNVAKLNEFISKYEGQEVGMYVDGFVIPISIPISNVNAGGAQPILSVGLSQEEDIAQTYDMLFNSGTIPLGLEITDTKDFTPTQNQINTLFLLGLGALFVLITFSTLHYISQKDSLNYLFSSTIFLAFAISLMKILNVPILVEQLIMLFSFFLIFSFLYHLCENKKLFVLSALPIVAILPFISFEVLKGVAVYIVVFVIAFPLFSILVEKYIQLFKNVIKR